MEFSRKLVAPRNYLDIYYSLGDELKIFSDVRLHCSSRFIDDIFLWISINQHGVCEWVRQLFVNYVARRTLRRNRGIVYFMIFSFAS